VVSTQKPTGPRTVLWALVVCVRDGTVHLIDYEFALEVTAGRPASLDDIYAACVVAVSSHGPFAFGRPSDQYSVAFLVFQMPDGQIQVSPDIFDDVTPVVSPTTAQVIGAFGVIQGQIIARLAADLAAQVAVQATMSLLTSLAPSLAEVDENKSKGGLIVA
jgi:hypothetical protein